MTRSTLRSVYAALLIVVAVGIAAGCSGPRIVDQADLLPVSGSGSDDLPPPVVRPAGGTGYAPPAPPPETYPTPLAPQATPPAPQAPTVAETVPPSWSTPAPVSQPLYQPPATGSNVGTVTRYYPPATATRTAAPATQATSLANRCWSGCGLPCQDGVSKWHARLVGGWPFFEGTDAPDPCSYVGADFGRTHCGCWGWDVYYRVAGCKYKRTETDATGAEIGTSKDGGLQHHFGLKLSYERSFGSSKWYGWGGIGGGYFVTDGFDEESDGWEVYGEAGIGYVINQTWRLRVGVNVHGFDDATMRRASVDSGSSRWLWLIAPVIQVEANF